MAGILGREPLTRRRFGAYTRGADGRATPGAAVDATIKGSIQPADDDDLQSLPEGERDREARVVLTKSDLRIADDENQTPADHLLIDGDAFEVRKVSRIRAILPHYRAIAVRLQES